uniref:Leucine-rich repeat transmembrane protein kinase n=1 Tax=Rhizophora mucronata TaxID=61149 RepID=A0A2P2KGE8_RHIMU
MRLSETSKYFNERRPEMAPILPEILQLEMSRDCSLVKLPSPEGKELSLLRERSRTCKFAKPESLAKLVNLLLERSSSLINEAKPFPEVGSNPMVPPSLLLDRLTSAKLCIRQTQAGTLP